MGENNKLMENPSGILSLMLEIRERAEQTI
jgi:hypothetical protein